MAFSPAGIWGVELTAKGETHTITTPTVNPATVRVELIAVGGQAPRIDTVRFGFSSYWKALPAGTVTATIIGLDGGRRELPMTSVGDFAGISRYVGRTFRAGESVAGSWVVLDGCTIIGDGNSKAHPIGGSTQRLWLKNCRIENSWRAQGATPNCQSIVGCLILNGRDDGGQGCYTMVDVVMRGIMPLVDADHADAVQLAAGTHTNATYYRVLASDLHDQGFFARSNGPSSNIALVDCRFEMALPLRRIPGSVGSAMGGTWSNVLIRSCVFSNPYGDVNTSAGFALWTESIGGVKKFSLTNSLVEGNTFGSWAIGQTIKDQIPAGTFKANRWGGSDKPAVDGIPAN